jgi:hypothetical protein
MKRFLARARKWGGLRILLALAVLAGIGLVVNRWAPTFVATLVALVIGAVFVLVAQRSVPDAGERIAGREPLKASLEPDEARLRKEWSVTLPKPLPTDGRPIGVDSLAAREWLLSHGAADMNETYLRLAVEGSSNANVRITNIRAEIVSRREPFVETSAGAPPGGDVAVVGLGLDLDEHDPVARDLVVPERTDVDLLPGPAKFAEPHFSGHQTVLSNGEVVVFRIIAQARKHCVEWRLCIDYTARGRKETLTLENGGRAMRTSPLTAHANRDWDWAWYEAAGATFVEITEQELGRRP